MDSSEPPDPARTEPASAGAAAALSAATLSPVAGEATELRKPHEMIVLMPRSRRVTLTGRRLYNALLQVAQARLAAMPHMPPADHMFEAPLPALLRTSGSSGEDRTAAKRYLREMRGLEVDWESTAPGDGLKWRGFSMLSEVAIELRHGENWVAWSYPPTLMAALKEPSRWARIDLDVLARLGTYAAVALYEICARYRDNPAGLTSRKPVQWWADALSPAPSGSERREWRKFKSERVKDAIEDINRETELAVELIEHKQGRAVVEAQFAVRRKRVAPRAEARPGGAGPVDAHLVLRAESLGIREIKLDGLVAEFGEAAVRSRLEQLERRTASQQLRGVENGYAYLRALLRQGDTAGAPQATPGADAHAEAGETVLADRSASAPAWPQQAVSSQTVTVQEPDPAAFGPVTQPATAPRPKHTEMPAGAPAESGAIPVPRPNTTPPTAAPAGPPSLRSADDDWLAARIAQLKRELAALDAAQRRHWVDLALAELASKQLLSAVVSRRAAQGDVLHGLLGSVIVRLYAQALIGPHWDKRAPP